MSDSISRIYDDYDDYERLCKFLKIESVELFNEGIGKSFYRHQDEILKEYKVETIWELYEKYQNNIIKLKKK